MRVIISILLDLLQSPAKQKKLKNKLYLKYTNLRRQTLAIFHFN